MRQRLTTLILAFIASEGFRFASDLVPPMMGD